MKHLPTLQFACIFPSAGGKNNVRNASEWN